jgi:hypothetical protein
MSNKMRILKAISAAGDCFVKLKTGGEFLCTTDFSTKYVKKQRKKAGRPVGFDKTKDNILVFNWDKNKFENIPVKDVSGLTPLQQVLKNED